MLALKESRNGTSVRIVELQNQQQILASIERTSETETTKARKTNGTHKVGGQMFVQMMVGQRVSVVGEEDVFKFTAVSFTLPDLLGKGGDMFSAIVKGNPLYSSLAENIISFNDQDSLLGAFGRSSKPVTEEHLQIFLKSLQAAENLVIQNKELISEQHFDEFLLKNAARKAKSDNLVEDAKAIYSNPRHGGAVAYKNSEKFGDNHVFRMEWLYKGGQILTIGPPSTGYKLSVLDERIVGKGNDDHGDSKFITTMLDFIKNSYGCGANSVFGLQVNSTATVSRCGGAPVEQELQKFDQQFNSNNNIQIPQITISASYSIDSEQITASQTTANITNSTLNVLLGSSTTSSGGGDIIFSDSESKNSCSKCGKANDRGIGVCTCMLIALKRDGNAASTSEHHH